MRKFTFTLLILLTGMTLGFAGGIVTNTNQSAMFVRMMARDASTDIDAVYYNPAALVLLPDGFYISINNQVIGKTNKVTNDYYLLHGSEYNGETFAPLFPGIYAVYSKGKFAYSFGVNPIAGGGSAKYSNGLSSTEMKLASIPSTYAANFTGIDVLTAASGFSTSYDSITDYRYATNFVEGTQVRLGLQAGISYEFSDNFSGFVGARYVVAPGSMNTTKVELTGVEFYSAYKGAWFTPGAYLQQINSDLEPVIGTAVFTPEAIADADAPVKDVHGDVSFSGSGYTPIAGLNLKMEKLNIAIKYEHLTRITLTTKVNDGKNAGGMFFNKKETRSDIPPMVSVGASYQINEKINAAFGFRHFWDFDANYGYENIEGQRHFIDKNTIEIALGCEYKLLDNLIVSAGYQRTQFSPSLYYQTSDRNALSSNTIGFGGTYGVNENLALTLGASFSGYKDFTRDYNGNSIGTYYNPNRVFATETYDKSAWVVAIGANFKLGGGSEKTETISTEE